MTAIRPLHSYMGSPLCIDAGVACARLVNGVFGDPLLEMRVQGMRQRIFFDLGEAGGLSRRELHTVSHVFVTHAHFDHICGFLSLLRTRIGTELPPCRIYGPPGIADHICGFIAGIHWDRIDDTGPAFLVGEVHESHVSWHEFRLGSARRALAQQDTAGGVLLDDPQLVVRCARLDHGIPVLSFALELPGRHHIRTDRMQALDLAPGPWLGDLLAQLAAGESRRKITLPNGQKAQVGTLAEMLVSESPRTRFVYATDFADTTVNRDVLSAHSLDADWLFCEATFRREHHELAASTGHLTTAACGEIAVQAGAKHLVPFHFSKRYVGSLDAVYAEIQESCPGIPITRSLGR